MNDVFPIDDELLAIVDEEAERVRGRPTDDAELAASVAQVSEAYTRRRETLATRAHDQNALVARLRFFLPRDLPKITLPLAELRRRALLPTRARWRVLDLGAGLGTTGLGLALFAAALDRRIHVQVEAVDRDARALESYARLADALKKRGRADLDVRTRTEELSSWKPLTTDSDYDFILLGLVLNELAPSERADAVEKQTAWLGRLSERLTEDGALIVLEPALRETSRHLQRVRDRVVAQEGAPHVFAPCAPTPACPLLTRESDWCHQEQPAALPAPLVPVARAAGLRYERLTFSYLTLRRQPGALLEGDLRMRHPLYRIVSAPLRSKGKLEFVGCGAQGKVRFTRLDRHASTANAALDAAVRGTLLEVPGEPTADGGLRVRPDTAIQNVAAVDRNPQVGMRGGSKPDDERR